MKKVLFLTPSLGTGGMERMLVLYANLLAENGYDVTVLNFTHDDESMRAAFDPRVHYRNQFMPTPNLWNASRADIFHGNFRLLPWNLWTRLHSPRYLHKKYVTDRYDVEIAFFRGAPVKIVSGYPKEDALNTVHLAWVHNDFRLADGYRDSFGSIAAAKKAYAAMDHVVCVSRRAMESFRAVIGETNNCAVQYNLLPVRSIREKAAEPPAVRVLKASFHIALVARLADRAKGQSRLIRIVKRLHDEGEDVSLALIGGGPDEAMLRELIETLDAGAYIAMPGMQSNPYPFVREADLVVCASHYEGFPLTLAEALIIGTPVLSTDCTGPTEVLSDGRYGRIVPDDDEALYQGVRAFLKDPSLKETYRAAGEERAEELDLRHGMEQIERFLTKAKERA